MRSRILATLLVLAATSSACVRAKDQPTPRFTLKPPAPFSDLGGGKLFFEFDLLPGFTRLPCNGVGWAFADGSAVRALSTDEFVPFEIMYRWETHVTERLRSYLFFGS